MKLIVNADDFGLTAGVCRAICELVELGAVTSTTAMVAAEGVVAAGVASGGRDLKGRLGLHLMLTGGRPVSGAEDVPSLVDASGCFRAKADVAPDVAEVRLEWRRQVEAFEAAYGFLPNHLDSHHSVHLLDGVSEVYWELARELDVPVRSGKTAAWNARMRAAGVRGPQWVSSGWSGTGAGVDVLEKSILDAFEQGDVGELVVHPGYVDAELRAATSWNDVREHERAALAGMVQRGWFEGQGITLVGWGEG